MESGFGAICGLGWESFGAVRRGRGGRNCASLHVSTHPTASLPSALTEFPESPANLSTVWGRLKR